MKSSTKSLIALAAAAMAMPIAAQTTINLHTSTPGAEVPETLYGIFFEDINFGADGGLYAELVKNRSFEFPQNLMGWQTFGNVQLMDQDGPFDRNPHYVRLAPPPHRHMHTGLVNEGFFGIGFHAADSLRFSCYGRCPEGGDARLKVELIQESPDYDRESQVVVRKEITISGTDWQKYTAVLPVPANRAGIGQLRIMMVHPGRTVDLEHISLFPGKTWKNRENGLRLDLAQALADLQPGVFRFPGGCIVEGTTLDTRYDWKNSVGPVENRPLNRNRWEYTFPDRYYPDYFQTYGLGFYEFFQLSEDIGAEPLPVVSVGLSCQYQNNSESAHVPVDSLQPYIQDALDLIEFANGPVSTPYGALRAEMGHPAPFNLKYIGVGNEQWGEEYVVRLQPFVDAIRAAWPDVKIVGSSGPLPEGDKFEYLWPEMARIGVDLVDEHYYRDENWFADNADRYDSYDRNGPKVFAGEYACHKRGFKRNCYEAALMEAALMTGIERNADIVEMATYAPLFAHVKGWQWRPDMIWFDNLEVYPSESYTVQQLFSTNTGDRVIPVTDNAGHAFTGNEGLYVSATKDSTDGTYIVKAINTADEPRPVTLKTDGERLSHAVVTSYRGVSMPESKRFAIENSQDWTTILPPRSVNVIKF